MIVVFRGKLFALFKKCLEAILEGSEQALLTFTASGTQIQSVDVLSVCMYVVNFHKSQFARYNVSKQYQVQVGVDNLFYFVKRCKNQTITFKTKKSNLWVYTGSGSLSAGDRGNCYKLSGKLQERSVYYSLPNEVFSHCPSFALHPLEFTNMMLELSVGGGYIDLTMEGTETLWQTRFETGIISLRALNGGGEGYRVLTPAKENFQNRYITKYLKQACGIAQSCKRVVVYLRPEGPLLLNFEMSPKTTPLLTVSIAPTKRS